MPMPPLRPRKTGENHGKEPSFLYLRAVELISSAGIQKRLLGDSASEN
tara:strand:- start:87273 stop:87416 length:144 start_codon:yes stop_codon:yes gene_type:complete